MRKNYDTGLRSLDRAIDILEELADAPSGLTLTKLAESCGLAPSTTHRILQTLMQRHLVRQGDDRRYYLGISTLSLKLANVRIETLRRAAGGFLDHLRSVTMQSVHLAVLEGVDVVYIETLASPRNFAVNQRVGRRNYLHCTSLGKAMLSILPESEQRRLVGLQKFVEMTPFTITNRERFEEELRRVKDRGYAFDREESEIGVHCIGAPIPPPHGHAVAAVSISGPAVQLPEALMEELAVRVSDIAARISQQWREAVEADQGTSVL